MIIYDAEITGSFKIDGTTISSIGSLDTLSGSIVTNSSSIASLEAASGSYANSASFATDISNNSSSIASLNAASASYLLNTTDTFTGDLTVTGEVIAQTLHVQQVTSSIVYSSGSNVFGETVADTQKFTGSLQVSGSDSHILGNLGIGTTSNFSGAELDVYGDIALAQQNWAIRGNAGNADLAIEELSGGAFNDGNVRLTVESGGNVGINTVDPTDKLDVRPSANSSYSSNSIDAVRIGRTAAGRPSISFDTSDTTYTNRVWYIENYGPSGSLIIGRNGLDVLNLKENADVLITGGWNPGNPSRLVIRGEGEYNNTFSRPGATLQIISDELSDNTWSPVFNIAVVRQSLTTGKDSFGGIGFSSIDDSNNNGMYDAARIAVINEAASSVVTPTSLAFYTNVGTANSGSAEERMRIDSSGRVGIGVSPSQLVHARKDQSTETRIRVENQSTSADAYSTIQLSTYGNTWGIRNGSTTANSNSLEFVLDSGGNNFNLFNIDSSGRVGIGVTPSNWSFTALQIKNSSLWSTGGDLGINANSYYDGSNYRYIGSSSASSRVYFNTDGSIAFYQAPTGTAGDVVSFTERMSLNSGGNLKVNNRLLVNTTITDGQLNVEGTQPFLFRNSYGSLLYRDVSTTGIELHVRADQSKNTFVSFTENAVADKWVIKTLASDNNLYFSTGNPSSNTNRVTFDSSGNVSLSTGDLFINSGTSYNDKGYIYLSNQRTAIISDIVNLTANGDTSLDFQTRSGGSTASSMFIDEFRRVGIGTTSPDRKLEVRSDTSGDVILARFTNRSGNSSDGAYIGFSTGYDAEATIGAKREGAENDSSLVFSPMLNESPVEKMRLTSTGILQLNTDVAPSLSSNFFISRGDQYGFHIHTQTGFTRLVASDDNLYLGTGTDTSTVTIKNATVGIGDTNPDNKLHVNSGTTNIAAKFESTDATGGIMLADSTGNVELTTSSTNGFNVQPGGGDVRFRIDGNGKIASRNSHDGQSYRREYTWSNGSVSNGTVVDLIENGSAYTDITFIAFIEVFHSGRTYRVIKGSFGGYGYNVTSSGNGIAALTQQVTGTGTAKLQFNNNSGYNASVHIHIIIYGDSSITVHNGYLSSL